MHKTFIYLLRDPITGRIRYVGKSDRPKGRLNGHLRDRTKNHRTNWLSGLKRLGLQPLLEIIDEVPFGQWQFFERAYIKVLREAGEDLVNSTDGGEGQKMTPAICEKIRRSKLGKQQSPEWIAAKNAALRGKRQSAQVLEEKRNRKSSKNSSGYVGVSRSNTSPGKWVAQFAHPGEGSGYLGIFSKLEDAVFARSLAMLIHYPRQ